MSVSKFMQRAAERDYSRYWQDPKSMPAMMQKPKAPLEARDYPVTVAENYKRAVTGNQPYWIPVSGNDTNTIWPDAIEEHPVPETVDDYDWWGVLWQWVPSAGGSITMPGTRVINDFEHWENDFDWPDLSLPDWKADGAKLAANLDPNRAHVYQCVEGITERVHEMMPFDEYLLSFYTEPEAMHRFLEKMADYKIELCQKVIDNYGRVDGVLYHDDWGTQRAGFYSNEMFREFIVPPTKRFFQTLKAQGKFIELHSCGKNIQYCPEMIDMGVDMWSPQQPINDPDELLANFNKELTFGFVMNLNPQWNEQQTRDAVDAYVEKFGANGRCVAIIRTKPDQAAIARDELYNYSLNYYNKLYKRV